MGTYSDSKVQTARKRFSCQRCHDAIAPGSRYLRYAAGQRNSFPVCLKCAYERDEGGHLCYYCAATVQQAA